MASNIDYISIDATYPIAGKDNDSQGFRDNFSVIKNNFQAAQGEINDLLLNTIRSDVGTNSFNNNTISNVNLTQFTQSVYVGGLVSSNTLVDYRNGPYQIFNVNNDVQFTISNFPNLSNLSKLTIQVFADGTLRNLTFVVNGASGILKSSRVPNTLSIPLTSSTAPIILEFWTYDGGNTILMDYLGPFA